MITKQDILALFDTEEGIQKKPVNSVFNVVTKLGIIPRLLFNENIGVAIGDNTGNSLYYTIGLNELVDKVNITEEDLTNLKSDGWHLSKDKQSLVMWLFKD
jgi:hypothetical protein